MFFYFLFALALFLPRRASLCSLLIVLLAGGLLSTHIPSDTPFFIAQALNQFLWEFGFGVGIAAAFCAKVRIPRGVSIAMICVGVALVARWDMFAYLPRSLNSGAPCALIVVGAVFLPSPDTRNPIWRVASFVGDLFICSTAS